MNDYNKIVEDNQDLIKKVVDYICIIKKIDCSSILKAPRETIKEILIHFQKIEYDLQEMKKDRDSFQENFVIMESNAGVSSQCYDKVQGGHDNGGRENPELNRQLAVLSLKEKIYRKTLDIQLFEETRLEKRQMIRDFIYLLPNVLVSRNIELFYFYQKSDDEIASELSFSYDYTRQSRGIGMNRLAIILKNYIQNLKHHTK